jgi:protein-S-isoprenylcysteine O-methyltransferase Ste14
MRRRSKRHKIQTSVNDTYLLTASIAAATLVWILWRLLRLRITARMALKRKQCAHFCGCWPALWRHPADS